MWTARRSSSYLSVLLLLPQPSLHFQSITAVRNEGDESKRNAKRKRMCLYLLLRGYLFWCDVIRSSEGIEQTAFSSCETVKSSRHITFPHEGYRVQDCSPYDLICVLKHSSKCQYWCRLVLQKNKSYLYPLHALHPSGCRKEILKYSPWNAVDIYGNKIYRNFCFWF